MEILQRILSELTVAAQFASLIPGAQGAALAAQFLAIAQTAVRAHESITGAPLDMAKLHDIDPVP